MYPDASSSKLLVTRKNEPNIDNSVSAIKIVHFPCALTAGIPQETDEKYGPFKSKICTNSDLC